MSALAKDKRRFHQKMYHEILKDWYGEERAKAEMTHYCPDSLKVSELVDKIMNKAVPEERLRFMSIKEKWQKLVGIQLGKVSEPITLDGNGIILVAVSHPAWMREMQGPVKNTIIANINKELGEEMCKDIKYIPAGR